jgi:hypothetical protein
MIVGSFQKPMTFEEYMLSESIAPTKTDYGCNPPDFNDTFININNNLAICCYVYNNILYYVQHQIATGEIGFGKSSIIPKTYEELYELRFDVKPMKTSDGLGVFNRTFYVFLEILKKSNTQKVFFKSANPDLENVYKLLKLNKYFNRILNDLGFSDISQEENIYVIRKKV